MLGVKLAQTYPRSVVLTLRPRGAHAAAHHALLELLRLPNNVPGGAPLGPPLLAALAAADDPPHFTLLGAEALFELLQVGPCRHLHFSYVVAVGLFVWFTRSAERARTRRQSCCRHSVVYVFLMTKQPMCVPPSLPC